MEERYAVLTGDLIASSKLAPEQLQEVMGFLQSRPEVFEQTYPGSVVGQMAVFRGDAWQMLLRRPEMALRCALYFRSSLFARFGVRTRLAIGIGGVQHIDEGNISASTGEAFERSGIVLNRLETVKRSGDMGIEAGGGRDFLYTTVRLLDALADRWTKLQARSIEGVLLGYTQKEIADACFKKTIQQNIAKALQSADWSVIEESLDVFEQYVSMNAL